MSLKNDVCRNHLIISIIDTKIVQCDSIYPVQLIVCPREFNPDNDLCERHKKALKESFVSVAILSIDGLKQLYGPSICSLGLFSTEFAVVV